MYYTKTTVWSSASHMKIGNQNTSIYNKKNFLIFFYKNDILSVDDI